ncbi:hypothetical protein MSG28_015557 [Choristoneura fumiferana]|uniref:Uncharacterized protein n=1 Tax=Choristoneura fumiferana TaxID=7141 RepID=A0ACC0KBJ5_CHOFU|nr:hypothetical protein MSG28_015557 [Choristoneura fumiferana]
MEITRTTLGIAVGIAGTLFLGYCVYFDQQRRKDPLFKKSSGNADRMRVKMHHKVIHWVVLQQTMPAPIFHLLLKKLPEVSERLRASMKASGGSMLQEEDVE